MKNIYYGIYKDDEKLETLCENLREVSSFFRTTTESLRVRISVESHKNFPIEKYYEEEIDKNCCSKKIIERMHILKDPTRGEYNVYKFWEEKIK